jgi:hypothetical protein
VPHGRDLGRQSGGRLRVKMLIVLVVAAAAAGAIAANLLLLGSAAANNAPIGRLSPRAHLPTAPHWTVRPARGRPHEEHADD